MATGRKLAIGGVIVAGVTAYMAFVGASTSWQYYLTVDECLADASSLLGDRIRITGKVARDSLEVTANRKQASFSLEGAKGGLKVVYSGPLPDNLAEGADVVVEGRLESPRLFRGEKVLTRCASKYESRRPAASSRSGARAGEGDGR